MDLPMDPAPMRDIKPTTTSLPIATFPVPTSTTNGMGSPIKRAITAATSSTKKTSPSSTTSGTRRRSGSSSSTWSGIRPVERQLMRPWLIQKIEEGSIEGLEWVDAAHTKFRIPWKHGSRQGWKTEQDACLFMHWAQHTGRYRGSEAPNAKRWKANFRCALNSLPDVCEVKTQSQTKGQNAFRVYEFLNERKPKVQHARTGSAKTKCATDGMKTDFGLPSSPADTTQDVKYPLVPTPCSTASTTSRLGHQNMANVRACGTQPHSGIPRLSASSQYMYIKEEPLDHSSYSLSPVPSPSDSSFSSSCSSDDPYSPCSPPPPPAHQHASSNGSKNWMLRMENESYRAIFPSTSSPPASLPARNTSTQSWGQPMAPTSTNSTYRPDVTATSSSPSHAFPASPPTCTATPVTSQPSVFNNGRQSSQLPYLTMDIGLSSHIDYDSGLGSPSSSGLGSPSSSHSDMDYACSDDGSDVSVEISRNHLQELKNEFLKTSQDQMTFQHYHQYRQRLQQLQQCQPAQHSPTPNNHTLHQMSPAAALNNRHHHQHSSFRIQQHNNNYNNNNLNIDLNNNLQTNQLTGDYSIAEALQNALCSPNMTEMVSLDPEEVESFLSEGPCLNVDYKITVKTGASIPSTIEANLTADIQNYNGRP